MLQNRWFSHLILLTQCISQVASSVLINALELTIWPRWSWSAKHWVISVPSWHDLLRHLVSPWLHQRDANSLLDVHRQRLECERVSARRRSKNDRSYCQPKGRSDGCVVQNLCKVTSAELTGSNWGREAWSLLTCHPLFCSGSPSWFETSLLHSQQKTGTVWEGEGSRRKLPASPLCHHGVKVRTFAHRPNAEERTDLPGEVKWQHSKSALKPSKHLIFH